MPQSGWDVDQRWVTSRADCDIADSTAPILALCNQGVYALDRVYLRLQLHAVARPMRAS